MFRITCILICWSPTIYYAVVCLYLGVPFYFRNFLWFILQIATIVRPRPYWSQGPGSPSRSSMQVTAAQVLLSSCTAFPGISGGSWIELDQAGTQIILIWMLPWCQCHWWLNHFECDLLDASFSYLSKICICGLEIMSCRQHKDGASFLNKFEKHKWMKQHLLVLEDENSHLKIHVPNSHNG